LNHDGKQEILVPRLLEAYAGADPVATFTDVYTFQNDALVESDRQFRDYYRNVRLPTLTAKLNQLRTDNANAKDGDASKAIHAVEKEIATINNLLAK
jgi:hypothetical protein